MFVMYTFVTYGNGMFLRKSHLFFAILNASHRIINFLSVEANIYFIEMWNDKRVQCMCMTSDSVCTYTMMKNVYYNNNMVSASAINIVAYYLRVLMTHLLVLIYCRIFPRYDETSRHGTDGHISNRN